MREGFALVAIGAAIGLLLGLGERAGAADAPLWSGKRRIPITFVGAPLLLMVVGAVAAFLPARRASRVDPASVLRAE